MTEMILPVPFPSFLHSLSCFPILSVMVFLLFSFSTSVPVFPPWFDTQSDFRHPLRESHSIDSPTLLFLQGRNSRLSLPVEVIVLGQCGK